MIMADQSEGLVTADSVQPFNMRSLYQLAGISFVVPDPITKGFAYPKGLIIISLLKLIIKVRKLL